MRISGNANVEALSISKANVVDHTQENIRSSQGSKASNNILKEITPINKTQEIDNSEETKAKLKDAVDKMNEMLEVNNSTSKFLFHEGLERYYVTVVDRETEEVVKEIPPKKLLDAFYEMQKMLGMIVDEKV